MKTIVMCVTIFSLFAGCKTFASQLPYNVRDYGAVGDGLHLDTGAIQAAVDACAREGGRVLFPPGTYLSGTIFMKSNVTLQISEGAALLGSTNIADYPEVQSPLRHYGDPWVKFSLIYGANLENVAVVGRGTIDGQGHAFQVTTTKKPDRYMNRPYVLRFIECRHLLVENLHLRNSASWMQHYLGCDGVTIRGIDVYNHCNKNNDMMDIDGCRNVLISDCIGDTDDDALTMKSTSERLCENIAITNCILSSHCNAIKMGTESHGGFRNVAISNIIVKPSEHDTLIYGRKEGLGGIVLLMVDGGTLEGVTISTVGIEGTTAPIFMRLGDRGRTYREGAEKPPVGILRDVHLSDITATGAGSIGCAIAGLPDHFIEDVTLSSIQIRCAGGGTVENARNVVPEKPEDYPESTMFGPLPAYGFYIRHVDGIELRDVDLAYQGTEERPAVVCDDVRQVALSGLRASPPAGAEPLIRLVEASDVFIQGARPRQHTGLFLSVEGETSEKIRLLGNDLTEVDTIYETVRGASANAILMEGNIR